MPRFFRPVLQVDAREQHRDRTAGARSTRRAEPSAETSQLKRSFVQAFANTHTAGAVPG